MGGIETGQRFTGGNRRARAVNITQRGLKDWSEQDIIELLESGATPEGISSAPQMTSVVRNTAQLSASDRAAIATYVKSCHRSRVPRGPRRSEGRLSPEQPAHPFAQPTPEQTAGIERRCRVAPPLPCKRLLKSSANLGDQASPEILREARRENCASVPQEVFDGNVDARLAATILGREAIEVSPRVREPVPRSLPAPRMVPRIAASSRSIAADPSKAAEIGPSFTVIVPLALWASCSVSATPGGMRRRAECRRGRFARLPPEACG